MRCALPIAATVVVAFGGGCKKDKPASSGAMNVDDPATCAACHHAVFNEWEESMHARAHHKHDPIYAGVRQLRMKKEGAAVAEACAGCHTPNWGGEDGKTARSGVACSACHNVARVHPDRAGAAALVRAAPGLLFGPHDTDPDATVAHGSGPSAAHLTDGKTICLACHAAMHSKSGVPICTTGPERDAAPPSDETCVSCHMPVVEGKSGAHSPRKTHRSHRFVGPHRAWYQDDLAPLQKAVGLNGQLTAEGVALTLANKTGHGFPTGFPGRQALLKAEGLDSAGARIWQSKPIVLGKRYEDADGKPTLAPWSVRLASDTRLKPGEVRSITFQPPEAVVRVKVSLIMRLLPPPLAAKLKLVGSLEAMPRVITTITLSR